MIDTIKFEIPTSTDLIKAVVNKCAILEKSKQNESIFKIIREEIYPGSYHRGVTITFTKNEKIYIEFSAPKYLYGHNIWLLYPQQLTDVLQQLNVDLQNYFGSFPPYMSWKPQRLDVCYNWQLQNADAVDTAILLLKSFPFPRKKPSTYDGTITYTGSAYTVKFYDKEKEFRKHDFKELQKEANGNTELLDNSYDILDLSKGVLRFEATIRKKQLDFEFGENITYKEFTNEFKIMELLNKYQKKFLRNLNTKTMQENEIHDLLVNRYKKTRGIQLFQFHRLYFSINEVDRKYLLQDYHRTQINYNLRQIANAGVGISDKNTGFNFDFSIPSQNVVRTPAMSPTQVGA